MGILSHPALSTSNVLGFPVLTLAICLPLAGALVVLLLRNESSGLQYAIGTLFAGATAALAIVLFALFQNGAPGFQFVDDLSRSGLPTEWLPGGITYQVGVDGIAIVLFALTALISFLVLVFSWGSVRQRVSEYVALLLVLETGVLGVFCAMDLFLFYVFWELTLVPMVLLIGVWGGAGRIYASMKFLLYTLGGSALMLVAIVVLVQQTGSPTYRLIDVLAQPPLASQAQMVLFAAFALAFAVKVPLFPFHTWLPDAHVEAPTGASVMLAALLLKMGTYGFVRFAMPLFPEAANVAAPVIMALAIVGVWYGAWVAFAQDDVKSLVAYSSVSHMGVVVAGLFAMNSIGLGGGVLQMVNHGLSTGALFLMVGMLYDRAHTRSLSSFGGVWRQMPVFSAFFLLVALASIGLPGLNGFVGEWLSLAGAYRANPWYGAFAAFGIVLGAAYMLWMLQRVLFGPTGEVVARLSDLEPREIAVLLPLAILIVWIGVHPETFLGPINATSEHWITLVGRGAWVVSGGR